MPTPEPLDEWQARIGREDADRPPRPTGRDRVRSAIAAAIGAAVGMLIFHLALGSSGAILGVWVLVGAVVGFLVRYVANPRPVRNPWE